MAARATAEEFYSRCLGNVSVLTDAARRFADDGDAVGALAAAWGADTYALQAVVWERILVASSYPQRQFFRVAQALVGALAAALPADHEPTSASDALAATRAGMLDACEPSLRAEVQAVWADASYLDALPAPTTEDLVGSVAARTGGLGPEVFAMQRRKESSEAMAGAQAVRVKGDTVAAIQSAYEADLLALEAYLIDSALALSDNALFTVTVRWELATAAVAALPGLPEGFVAAVTRIREALAAGLGDAEGARLQATLSAI